MPQLPYASLAQLKDALNKESGLNDATLALALDGATAFINGQTGRRFDQVTEMRAFDVPAGPPWDAAPRRVAIGDVVSVSAVSLLPGTGATPAALAGTDWYLEPVHPDPGWPYRTLALSNVGTYPTAVAGFRVVQVTGVWGWPGVPADIVQVCISLAIRWWQAAKAGFSDVVGTTELGAPVFSRHLTGYDRDVLDFYAGKKKRGVVFA